MTSLTFLEMVLGFNPEQKIMIVLGFVYHDLLLNALSVVPAQGQAVSGAIRGLNQLTMLMGMIGALILILNRSLWNVKTILSWLVIMLLVTLGGRGDVLYTSLSTLGFATTQTTLGAPQSPAGTIQTSNIVAAISPKQPNQLTTTPPSGQNPGAGASPPPPTTATFPTYGQHIMQQLSQVQGVNNNTQIGGFTPIVITLYAFNRLNLLLMSTLKISAVDEIAKRMEKIPDVMFTNIVSPTAKAMVDTYVKTCGNAEHLRLDPDILKKRMAGSSGKTVYQQLQAQGFNYNDLVVANDSYFNSPDPNIRQYTFPYFASDPDANNYATLNNDAKDHLVINLPPDQAAGSSEFADLITKELNRRSGGPLGPNMNLAQIANNNLPSSQGLDMNKPITLMTIAPKVLEDEFDQNTGAINNFSTNCIRDFAVTAVTTPGAIGAAVARLSPSSCRAASDVLAFNNCAEMHAETHKRLIAATAKAQLEKDLMDALVAKAVQSGLYNSQGQLVADVGGLSDQELILLAVREFEKARKTACADSGQGIGAAWEFLKSIGNASTCDEVDKQMKMLQGMLQAKAIRGTTTFYEQLYKTSYDPSSLFISDLREMASKAGELLGPVVLWFGALFGGFGAGSYGGIVPHFMAFIIGFMIAVAPLMFLVGLLMPGWAFGILLTPIGVVAYMKMVEVMFTVVTSIFTMFKPAVTSDWVAITSDNEGLVNLQTAIYDIVVGLSYTSMFGVAGYVMFSMGNPGALMGAMKSIDSQAKIEFKDVLAAGAAIKGGLALYDKGRNLAKGAVKQGHKVMHGEIPFISSPSFIGEGIMEARSEIGKNIGMRTALKQSTESFIAQTTANQVDTLDNNRAAGQAALFRAQENGGKIAPASDKEINIIARAANIKSTKADVDAQVANNKAIEGWQGVDAYRQKKEVEAENKAWDEDINERVQGLRSNERQTLLANTSPAEQDDIKNLQAYAEHFSASDKAVKNLSKRLGFGNDVKDTFIRDNGIEYEGSGAFDVTKAFLREVIKEANPNLSNDRYDSLANVEMIKILMANKFKRSDIITRSAPASVDTNFQPGDPNRITPTTVTVNVQAPGMADFMARYAAAVQNVQNGRLNGAELNLSSPVRPKGTIRTP